jgi:hypothetical protein
MGRPQKEANLTETLLMIVLCLAGCYMLVQALDFDAPSAFISFLYSVSLAPVIQLIAFCLRILRPVVRFSSNKGFQLPSRVFDYVADGFEARLNRLIVALQSLGL